MAGVTATASGVTAAAPPIATPGRAPARLLDVTSFLDGRDLDGPRPRQLNRYYALKPMLPRALQMGARRAYARRQARRGFPAWPIETRLVDELKQRLRSELRSRGVERVAMVNFWPRRHRFAFILTHDVEGPRGIENIPRLLEIERRQGLVSSWNFVAEDYPIAAETFAMVRGAGGEIGLHGLRHDGLMFADRAAFRAQLPRIRETMARWGAVGFRSPATHRERAWMHELGCLYDSSFPDTDPFQPHPGGCCSIWPFFIGDMVELPITMPQDHTLLELLRHRSIDGWVEKSGWLAANHGLINLLVHPDYMLGARRLDLYERLLAHVRALAGGWHALPREVAMWWRARASVVRAGRLGDDDGTDAAASSQASIAYAREEGEDIVFDV